MSEYCGKILTEAKTWVGRETKLVWGRYPVEREPIRRWCHMVNCNNPLYLDEQYAKKTRWGGIICPPLMIPIFGHLRYGPSSSGPEIEWPPATEGQEEESGRLLPPTAGRWGINLGGPIEFLRAVRLGDRIGHKEKLTDVYMKPIRLDPEAFAIVTETIYVNQYWDVVAKVENTMVKHRNPDEIKATTPEQLLFIRSWGKTKGAI